MSIAPQLNFLRVRITQSSIDAGHAYSEDTWYHDKIGSTHRVYYEGEKLTIEQVWKKHKILFLWNVYRLESGLIATGIMIQDCIFVSEQKNKKKKTIKRSIRCL